MLLKHGSFSDVEVELQRYKNDEEQTALEGGWHTVVSLQSENWTELLGLNPSPSYKAVPKPLI